MMTVILSKFVLYFSRHYYNSTASPVPLTPCPHNAVDVFM